MQRYGDRTVTYRWNPLQEEEIILHNSYNIYIHTPFGSHGGLDRRIHDMDTRAREEEGRRTRERL